MAGMQKGQSDGSVGGFDGQIDNALKSAAKTLAGVGYGRFLFLTEDTKGFLAEKEGWANKSMTRAVLKDTEGFIKMPAGVKLAPIDMDPSFAVKPMETPVVASSGGRGGGADLA